MAFRNLKLIKCGIFPQNIFTTIVRWLYCKPKYVAAPCIVNIIECPVLKSDI